MKSVEFPMQNQAKQSQAPLIRQTDSMHHPLIIALHWFTLAALVMGVSAILLRELTEGRLLRLELLNLHRSVGLLVLLVSVARLTLRKNVGRPAPAHDTPRMMRLIATLSHGALYLLLLVLPLLGWALTSAHGQHASLFGLIPLPPLTASDPDLADTLANCHVWASWTLLALVIAHAGAALWHHHIWRDHVLTSMLPKRRNTH
jgi:cytochrome b561